MVERLTMAGPDPIMYEMTYSRPEGVHRAVHRARAVDPQREVRVLRIRLLRRRRAGAQLHQFVAHPARAEDERDRRSQPGRARSDRGEGVAACGRSWPPRRWSPLRRWRRAAALTGSPVKTQQGLVQGTAVRGAGRRSVQGHSLRRGAGRQACASASRSRRQDRLERRARRQQVGRHLHPAFGQDAADRRQPGDRHAGFAEDFGRLPQPQRVDPGQDRRRQAAGDGVVLRRRLHRRRRLACRSPTAATSPGRA